MRPFVLLGSAGLVLSALLFSFLIQARVHAQIVESDEAFAQAALEQMVTQVFLKLEG